jgi:hypothetical protein
MSQFALISVLIAFIGLAFAVTGIRRLFQRRFIRGVGLQFSGLFFLLLASSLFLLASNLYTYQPVVFEQVVAEVSFEQLPSQEFRAQIKAPDAGLQQTVDLKGDEWRLDTQHLTWQGILTLFGLDANYRLHRISGRYHDIEDEQSRDGTTFSLTKKPAYIDAESFDLWQFAHQHQQWLHWVDADYGKAAFLPMTDGAKYQVAISRSGLIARPANIEARKAVSQWISL